MSADDDFESDPIGAIHKSMKGLEYRLAKAEVEAGLRQQVAAYSAEHPDYGSKFSYLMESRVRELKALGIDDGHIERTLQQESTMLAELALKQNKNPAQLVDELAVAKGYAGTGRRTEKAGDPWAADSTGASERDPWTADQPSWAELQATRERTDDLNAPGRSIFEE